MTRVCAGWCEWDSSIPNQAEENAGFNQVSAAGFPLSLKNTMMPKEEPSSSVPAFDLICLPYLPHSIYLTLKCIFCCLYCRAAD